MALTLSLRKAPLISIFGLVLVPATSALAGAAAWATRAVVDAASTPTMSAVGPSVILAGVVGLRTASAFIQTRMAASLYERLGFAMDEEIMMRVNAYDRLDLLESPDFHDRLTAVRSARGEFGQAMSSLAGILSLVVEALGLAYVALRIHPLVGVFALAGLPFLAAEPKLFRRSQAANLEVAPLTRMANALLEAGLSTAASRDLRCMNAAEAVIFRHRELMDKRLALVRGLVASRTRLSAARGLTSTAGVVCAVAFTAYLFARGDASLGEVAAAFLIASQLSASSAQLLTSTSFVSQLLQAVTNMTWLLDALAEGVVTNQDEYQAPAGGSVCVQDVHYRYPGRETDAVAGATFTVEPGSVVAIVGPNGAGKSTLIKLICGLYLPSQGSVQCGGVALDATRTKAWRMLTAPVFQDYAKFEFLLREAVGVAQLDSIDDDALIRDALSRAGLDDLETTLPNGLDTQLGRRWENGVDLSTGQWQRLAIARAHARRTSALSILDEPTASLDPIGEERVFADYAQASDDARARGHAVVFVSHRLAAARLADMIVVMEKGRVVEAGTHDHLMSRREHYWRHYTAQASLYQAREVNDVDVSTSRNSRSSPH